MANCTDDEQLTNGPWNIHGLPDHSNGWINYLNIQTDVTILQTDANVF